MVKQKKNLNLKTKYLFYTKEGQLLYTRKVITKDAYRFSTLFYIKGS